MAQESKQVSEVPKTEKEDLDRLYNALEYLCIQRINVIHDTRKRNIIPGLFKSKQVEKHHAQDELDILLDARKSIRKMQAGNPQDLPDEMTGLVRLLTDMKPSELNKYGGSDERKNLNIIQEFCIHYGPQEEAHDHPNFDVLKDEAAIKPK